MNYHLVIALLFLNFSFIKDSSLYYYKLELLQEFQLPTYFSTKASYYFVAEAISQDSMYIRYKTNKYEPGTFTILPVGFSVQICGYKDCPDETQAKSRGNCVNSNTPDITYDDIYQYHKFTFKTLEDVNWLSFVTRMQKLSYNLNYLTVYVFSEKAMEAWLLAIIIVAPILLIGAVVGVVLKKLGCIKR